MEVTQKETTTRLLGLRNPRKILWGLQPHSGGQTGGGRAGGTLDRLDSGITTPTQVLLHALSNPDEAAGAGRAAGGRTGGTLDRWAFGFTTLTQLSLHALSDSNRAAGAGPAAGRRAAGTLDSACYTPLGNPQGLEPTRTRPALSLPPSLGQPCCRGPRHKGCVLGPGPA